MVGASRSSLLPPSEPLLGSGRGLRISLTASPLPCTAGELGLWGLLGPVTLESDGQEMPGGWWLSGEELAVQEAGRWVRSLAGEAAPGTAPS